MAPYQPRFFNAEDFEGVVAIIETMIDSGGEAAASPRLAAERVDGYLSSIDSPAREAIRLAINAIDSKFMPFLLSFKFGRFSQLPLAERRQVVEKIITPKGMFKLIAPLNAGLRDAARTLKLLASAGYYNSAEGMAQVGYAPVDARPRFAGIDQRPLAFPDPFPRRPGR